MSYTEKSKEFYEMVDAYIAVASEQEKSIKPGMISATILYSAARFNTYFIASSSGSASELASKKEAACKYLMEEYQKMLNEHFDDFTKNYDKHLR